MQARIVVTLAVAACTVAACASASAPRQSEGAYDAASLPAGALGAQIRYGRRIVTDTRRTLPGLVGAAMDCAACHIDGGTKPRGGSFLGLYAEFPQWNKRAHRVIALQDRIAECFLYSENGTPPAYSSREMIAVVSYIAWLSRGARVFSKEPGQSFVVPLPSAPPQPALGARLYSQRCVLCHGADGAGSAGIPALWGDRSFNTGAGMAHLDRMSGFIYYNMPQNAPRTLSMKEAYDVAAFVLSHRRPAFRGRKPVRFAPEPARYF